MKHWLFNFKILSPRCGLCIQRKSFTLILTVQSICLLKSAHSRLLLPFYGENSSFTKLRWYLNFPKRHISQKNVRKISQKGVQQRKREGYILCAEHPLPLLFPFARMGMLSLNSLFITRHKKIFDSRRKKCKSHWLQNKAQFQSQRKNHINFFIINSNNYTSFINKQLIK